MKTSARLLLPLLFLAHSLLAQAASEEVHIQGIPKPLVLWKPDTGHIPKKWPVVIYYHGTYGKPSIQLMRNATGGENFILLGTTYLKSGRLDYSPENLSAELTNLQKLKRYLIEKHQADPKRIFVAGFSKGGWATSAFLERDHDLAGGLILGAGVFDQGRQTPAKPFSGHPKPQIFIGVGRNDGNYPQGLRALLHFRKLGAEVEMETWPKIGHDYPQKQPTRLAQWLQVIARPPELKNIAQTWVHKRFSEIQSLESPTDRWQSLDQFIEQPFTTHFAQKQRYAATQAISKLSQDPKIITEIQARKQLREILKIEIRDRYVTTLKKVNQLYLKLSTTSPDTIAGQQALNDVSRTRALLEHTQKASKK